MSKPTQNSCAAAGLQDIVSGYLIEGKKTVIEVMNDSLALLLAIYFRQIHQKKEIAE